MLTALGLPEDPDELLAANSRLLDDTYQGVAGRFAVNDAVSVDSDGRLHVERIKAIPEPGSPIDLRKRVNAMLPRVDLPEVLLEVMGSEPAFLRRSPRSPAAAPGWQTWTSPSRPA